MKTLHISIIVILFVFVLANIGHVFADNDSIPHLNVATDYGGRGIMVGSNQTMAPALPSPPLGMYPYTSKIFSVFQINPEIIHPSDTSSINILVTNNANFTLYDVNLGESVNDSKSMMISNIHKIDILNPNQTKIVYGTLHVSTDVQPTDYYDIWWNVIAKNQTGNMMESMQFHRNLPITQNLSQYYTDTTVITLESPLKQFKSGMEAKDVQCNEGLSLVIKAEDNSPACVKPDTAQMLVERGWAQILVSTTTASVDVNGTRYEIPYTIHGFGNKILYMTADTTKEYLVAHVESTAEKGELTLSIPRMLLDPQEYGQSEFTVLVDGIETKHAETVTGDIQTLTIPFGFGAKEIEVVALGMGIRSSTENTGTLSGNVVLAGGPRSGPNANYEVDVYATDGITVVGKTLSDANGHYLMQLPSGNYTIYVPDYPTKQTHLVSVFSGKNTILNIVYGTGYK